LKARVVYDRIEQTLRAAKGAVYALYNSGGTIPDRGYTTCATTTPVRSSEISTKSSCGKRSSPDFFARHSALADQTHHPHDVLAVPAKIASSFAAILESGRLQPQFFYSDKIGEFLERANRRWRTGNTPHFLPT